MKNSLALLCMLSMAATSCPTRVSAQEASVCKETPLEQSQAMIRAILNDIGETYTQGGGGGISSIQQTATRTYVVSISQEERIDQIRYELALDERCQVSILSRNTTTVSQPGRG